MRYLFLIYSDEGAAPHPGTKEFDDYARACSAFTDEVEAKGAHQQSAALRPVATATTVRVRDGKPQTTDGPFADTDEQLCGYYLMECKDLDEALEYAARIPTAAHGAIEVRPVLAITDHGTS